MRYAMLVLMAGFVSLSPLAAQGPLPVTPGQRVRLTFDGGRHRIAGVVVSQDSGSVTVQRYPELPATVIAQSGVTAVEVSASRHSNAGTGALIGLLGGGAIGAAAGASCQDEWLCPGPAVGGFAVGFLGAALGGVIGAFSHHETWQSVYQQEVHVSLVTPVQGRGLGVGLRIAF